MLDIQCESCGKPIPYYNTMGRGNQRLCMDCHVAINFEPAGYLWVCQRDGCDMVLPDDEVYTMCPKCGAMSMRRVMSYREVKENE